jgi:hypothetical protein
VIYVDIKAADRAVEITRELLDLDVLKPEAAATALENIQKPYVADGSLSAPFLTFEEARAEQQRRPVRESIVVAGYATIANAGQMVSGPPTLG